jgi:hypothetical protein
MTTTTTTKKEHEQNQQSSQLNQTPPLSILPQGLFTIDTGDLIYFLDLPVGRWLHYFPFYMNVQSVMEDIALTGLWILKSQQQPTTDDVRSANIFLLGSLAGGPYAIRSFLI